MRTNIFLISFFLLATLTKGQEHISDIVVTTIETEGNAELEIMPNEFFIRFCLKEQIEDLPKITITTQEANLKSQLQKLGLDPSELKINETSDYFKIPRQRNQTIAIKDYTIKVGNTEEVTKVFELLDKMKDSNPKIQKVNHSALDKYWKQLKSDAIKDAREKANDLGAIIGKTLGEPLSVRGFETSNSNLNMDYMMMNIPIEPVMASIIDPMMKTWNDSIMGSANPIPLPNINASLPEIGFQMIKLKYTVTIRFTMN